MLTTGQADLDDKILHYVLLAVGFAAYQFVKQGLSMIGMWEWKWVLRITKKIKHFKAPSS